MRKQSIIHLLTHFIVRRTGNEIDPKHLFTVELEKLLKSC